MDLLVPFLRNVVWNLYAKFILYSCFMKKAFKMLYNIGFIVSFIFFIMLNGCDKREALNKYTLTNKQG
jgi:hypothetical protein